MTWSISTSGNRQQVTESLTRSAAEGQSDQTRDQHGVVRTLLLDEVAKLPDDAYVSISASGHVDNGTSRFLNVSLSSSKPARRGDETPGEGSALDDTAVSKPQG